MLLCKYLIVSVYLCKSAFEQHLCYPRSIYLYFCTKIHTPCLTFMVPGPGTYRAF